MPDKPRFFYGYVIVIMSFFGLMINGGQRSVFGILFKPMIMELGWTRALTSGSFSLCVIMAGLVGIVLGGLNDRFGPRLVLTFCSFLSTLGYILMSQIQTVWELYLFYGIMVGAGSNTYVPLLSTVARWFVKRRSMMTGIVFAGAGVGMLIIPLVASNLISRYGWRVSCVIVGLVIMLVIGSTAQFLKKDPEQIGQMPYGKNEIIEGSSQLEVNAFSFREAACTKQFWVFLLTLACYGFCFSSLHVHIAPYVTDQGFSSATAAATLSTLGGTTIIGQIGLGSAGDKLGYKRTFLIGITLITLSAIILLLYKGIWAFFIVAGFVGVGFGSCSTVQSPIIAWLFGLVSHGLILGFSAFSFTIGASVGPLMFGYIFDVTGGYQLAFLVCIALSVVAVILTILLKQPTKCSGLNRNRAAA